MTEQSERRVRWYVSSGKCRIMLILRGVILDNHGFYGAAGWLTSLTTDGCLQTEHITGCSSHDVRDTES